MTGNPFEMNFVPMGMDSLTLEREQQERKKAFSRIGLALLTLMLVTVVMQYAIYGFAFFISSEVTTYWWFDWVLSLVPLYGFGLPIFMLVLRTLEKGEHCSTYMFRGMTPAKPQFKFYHFLLLTVVGFGLMYIGSIVGTILMTVMSALVGYDYQNALSSIVDNSPTWMVFIGTVLIAPIGEEFLFRKLLIDRTRKYGDVASILVSAIAFGLFHGNFFQFFYALFLGAVLAYMYTWTGKLWWSIGLHMFINLMGSIVMPGIIEKFPLEGDMTTDPRLLLNYLVVLGVELVIFGLIIGAIVAIVCLFCMRKVYVGKGTHGLQLPQRIRSATVIGNVGMIIALVAYVLLLLTSLIPLA